MEAVGALSLASNLVQFVDFGTKLCARIREFSTIAGKAPGKLQTLADHLDLVLKTIDNLDKNSWSASDHEEIVIRCKTEVKKLSDMLEKFMVDESKGTHSHWHKGMTKVERLWKAFKSLHAEAQIEEALKSLDRLLNLLNLQQGIRVASELDNARHEINVKTDTSQTVGPAKYIIPFTRNPRFVGREQFLEQIEKRFDTGNSRVALYGLGGVGKSQIAIEYAFRLREKSPQTSIFWIFTSDGVKFEEAYRRIARSCGIPTHDAYQNNTLQLVKDWFENTYPLKWLMIIDNVDNYGAFFEERFHGKPLCEYIPQSENGSVLYTSRIRDIAVDLIVGCADREPIEIEKMSREEAEYLLGGGLVGSSTKEERSDLLEELDSLPLAITQAAAFMTKRRKTIRQYLEIFRSNDAAKIRLLRHKFSEHGREERQAESLATTFMVSFNYLRSEHPHAAGLLAMMSFTEREYIPKHILRGEDEDSMELEESLDLLIAFSFINFDHEWESGFDPNFTVYNMHRLVQWAIHAWLVDEGPDRWPESFSRSMAQITRYTEEHPLPAGPESIYSLPLETFDQDTRLSRATYYATLALYEGDRGEMLLAETLATESYEIRRHILGNDHPETWSTIVMKAQCKSRFTLSQWIERSPEEWGEEDSVVESLLREALYNLYRYAGPEDRRTCSCLLILVELLMFGATPKDDQVNTLFQEIEKWGKSYSNGKGRRECYVRLICYCRDTIWFIIVSGIAKRDRIVAFLRLVEGFVGRLENLIPRKRTRSVPARNPISREFGQPLHKDGSFIGNKLDLDFPPWLTYVMALGREGSLYFLGTRSSS